MRFQLSRLLGFVVVPTLLVQPVAAWGQASTTGLGEVRFETSCAPEVRGDFNRAVALLHSFEFEESRGVFESVSRQDRDCAMAHWGVAMTYYHPLWAPPTERDLELGSAAAERARSLPATDGEEAFIEAISTFYRDHDRLGHGTRARAYHEAMAQVHTRYPDDPEAEVFHLLATLSTVDPTDRSYAVQRRTGARLEAMLEEMPGHPGILHYIIHSYDYPSLADRAVDAAHRYLDVAHSASHAMHMSGHIFTQEGMWEETIRANTLAAEAAREMAERLGSAGQARLNETHALDYLAYAYLQRGQDERARDVLEHLQSLEDLNWRVGVVAFNTGAVAVRYAMERRAWAEAASLPLLREAEGVGNYETRMAVVLRHWARAVGAARSGRIGTAEAELEHVARTAKELEDDSNVWARNTSEVLRLEAAAWLALARGNGDRALELMRSAAALEDQTDKSGLSPGRVLPAHEQLGDLLLELDRPEEALREYERSLRHADRRFNSFVGAARAARAAGKTGVAREYCERLLSLAAPDSRRDELDEARRFLETTR